MFKDINLYEVAKLQFKIPAPAQNTDSTVSFNAKLHKHANIRFLVTPAAITTTAVN